MILFFKGLQDKKLKKKVDLDLTSSPVFLLRREILVTPRTVFALIMIVLSPILCSGLLSTGQTGQAALV